MSIKSKIRTIPDFPKKGIMFRDITTLLKDADGLREVIDAFVERYGNVPVDVVVGLEARGFILGGAVAYRLGKGFVPVRKKGKLPYRTERHEYELEYGTDVIEMHVDAIAPGDRVLIVDDLLATGGTALAAAKLVEKLGGAIVEMAFIVDLPDVGGRARIAEAGYRMFALCEFEGD
ncbi:MAG: adenine phosphoribosyltransferase [Spirochaetes bacterium]|jgi:adenine phosphoribosyltransferase|nr:adenine phosphoribosyltransferase [Spirochaetota bacterium]